MFPASTTASYVPAEVSDSVRETTVGGILGEAAAQAGGSLARLREASTGRAVAPEYLE